MIDVLKYRRITAAISVAIFLSYIGYFTYLRQTRGYAYTYSVDFEGGTQAHVKFSVPVNTAQVRAALEKQGWQGATTRQFSAQEILVRVSDTSAEVAVIAQRIGTALQESFPGVLVEVLESELITPTASETLRFNSLIAVALCLIAMLIYIGLRFWSISFGLGALISLFHDAVVVLAAFLFLHREVSSSLIVAIIALLGYSLNDTIVIFARIREVLAENERLKRVASIEEVVTESINKTLRRTVLTSAVTTLSVIAMLLLGYRHRKSKEDLTAY